MSDMPLLEPSVAEELCAKALGQEMLRFARAYQTRDLVQDINSRAVSLLADKQKVLNDPALDDPECFQRIDTIVDAFHRYGLSTSRHDF